MVLVAPLDWGLGHASRCIPIIKYLNSTNCNVIVATDGMQQSLLMTEFPENTFVKLPGYRITLSKNSVKTLIKILSQVPKILISINRESKWLKHFIVSNKVNVVISDNRYGLFSKNIPSIFITHQLTIKTPFGSFFEDVLRKINYRYINQFTECWIPDYDSPVNMGGELSHPESLPMTPVKFLGRLSRIIVEKSSPDNLQLLIMLSGPEPQRSIFEEILLKQLVSYKGSTVLIRGLPGVTGSRVNKQKNVSIYNHLSTTELNSFLNDATFIISRSGYSTVMDLAGLDKKCIFVPTPGQSEQEYLAEYLSSKSLCLSYKQSNFDLVEAITEAASYKFEAFKNSQEEHYKKVINDFIDNFSLNQTA